MNRKPFDYFRPQSLAELMEMIDAGSFALDDAGNTQISPTLVGGDEGKGEYRTYHSAITLIGGGTDVLTRMSQGLISPRTVISLRGLKELKKLEQNGRDVLIGAGLSLHMLEESPLISDNFPALAQAAGYVGSPQLRNMGTVGGNIRLDTRCLYLNQPQWPGSFPPCYKRGGNRCHVVKGGNRCYALFSADTPAALLAYDARISLAGPLGEREVALDEFYRDDGLSCCLIGEKELIMGIKLTLRPHRTSSYLRLSARGAIDFPLVGMAVALEKDTESGAPTVRIAATGVLSRPVRLKKMEEILAGDAWPREMTEDELAEGINGLKIVRHYGLSPSYRRELLKVLVKRALDDLLSC